jgi:hypothetical protein
MFLPQIVAVFANLFVAEMCRMRPDAALHRGARTSLKEEWRRDSGNFAAKSAETCRDRSHSSVYLRFRG